MCDKRALVAAKITSQKSTIQIASRQYSMKKDIRKLRIGKSK